MEQMWDKVGNKKLLLLLIFCQGNAKQYERTIKAEIAEVFYDNI